MKNDVTQPVDKVLQAATAVRDKTQAGIRKAGRKAGTVLTSAREKGEAVIDDTKEKGYRAAAETGRLFQEHPVAAVAAAVAAGAVLAIFMPRLAIAGRAAQLAKSAAKAAIASETAQAVIGNLKDSRDAALRTATGAAGLAMGERMFPRHEAMDDTALESEADGDELTNDV